MTRNHVGPLLLAGLLAGLLGACTKDGEETGKPKSEGSPVKHGTNGETIVTLDAPAQKRVGLRVQTPTVTQMQPELKGYGSVVDPGPLASLTAELISAHVAADTSQREFERLKALAAQANASVRSLQAAEGAAKRDVVLVESLRTRLTLGWGKTLLEREDLPAFVKSLTSGERTLVRIDLPPGERLNTPLSTARLVPLGDNQHPAAAEFFDTATTVDPQTQGQGLFFLIAGSPAGFSPKAAVTGYLKAAGQPSTGVLVPSAAVIRHEGKAWVYVQTGDQEFTRREISLDRPADGAWFISSGVTDKDRLVVRGAQTILSEELSGGSFLSGGRE
jgi:hypothetical protein